MNSITRPALLYLPHRIPYPPNKGDKLRSFNLLRKLAEHHRVFLGTFIDDTNDAAAAAGLHELCAEIFTVKLAPALARALSLRGLTRGTALSVAYYRNARLAHWVGQVMSRERIDRALAFSGPMAQYLRPHALATRIIDYCDVDSAKWALYAETRPWPLSWLYRRESRRLLAFERDMGRLADTLLFSTDDEASLFRTAAPELAAKVATLQNGVDVRYFSPRHRGANPYAAGGPVLVFAGAMDYWPNVDAVTWFAREVLPGIRADLPAARFSIVGMNPTASVRALAREEGVIVTGKVDDVRPWVAHAALSVAPLRIARGVQNKVLEAAAMGKAVVLSPGAMTGLSGRADEVFAVAATAAEFRARITDLLEARERRDALGKAARAHVQAHHSWDAHLSLLDRLLPPATGRDAAPSTVETLALRAP